MRDWAPVSNLFKSLGDPRFNEFYIKATAMTTETRVSPVSTTYYQNFNNNTSVPDNKHTPLDIISFEISNSLCASHALCSSDNEHNK